MKKYLLLLFVLLSFAGLHQLKDVVQSHREERELARAAHTIEIYVGRLRWCRAAFPRANSKELHECATK